MNEYGRYGSKFSSTSIFNQYGIYGSQYSMHSPFNQYSTTPPRIFLRGMLVGYLTANKYVQSRVDPHQLYDWMRQNGL